MRLADVVVDQNTGFQADNILGLAARHRLRAWFSREESHRTIPMEPSVPLWGQELGPLPLAHRKYIREQCGRPQICRTVVGIFFRPVDNCTVSLSRAVGMAGPPAVRRNRSDILTDEG